MLRFVSHATAAAILQAHWPMAPSALTAGPRKLTAEPVPLGAGRMRAAEPFGGCWPGTKTSNAVSFAYTYWMKAVCPELAIHFCAMHMAAAFGAS